MKITDIRTTLALTSAVIVALGTTSTADDQAGPSAAPSSATSTPQTDSFAVLRRSSTPSDVMPADVRTMLQGSAARAGVNLDQARAVAAIGLDRVWLIPGPGNMCLAVPDPVDGFGVNCTSLKEATQGKLWVSLVGAPGQSVGDARMAIFVPDGVGSAVAVAADGARRALDVSNNVAVADLTNSDTVQFADSAGATHVTEIPGTPADLVASGQ
jgi:hypothetical protein